MNPAEMDIRSFHGKIAPVAPPKIVYADAMTRAIECSSATAEEKERMLKLYEETRRPTEMTHLLHEFDFEPSIDDLAHGSPPMSFLTDEGCFYRYPTDEEMQSLVHQGQRLRFPVAWTMDGVKYETYGIPKREWDSGQRWTMRRFLQYARQVYSKNKGKALKDCGDHRFFEGIDEDGTIILGS